MVSVTRALLVDQHSYVIGEKDSDVKGSDNSKGRSLRGKKVRFKGEVRYSLLV